MKKQRKKAYVSNPLANATGKQYNDSGKTLTLDTSKLGQAGKLANSTQKPYKPVECGMYKLPKYFLPDVKTVAPFAKGKGEVGDIMDIFKKYPSLDYVSAYHFSTKDSEVNKEVWKKFLDLYDQGYIKRIYDKINGYFASGLPNYVKEHSQSEIDSYFIPTYVEEVIAEEITTNNGFKSNSEWLRILRELIYNFISNPEELFEAMYKNAKQQLLTEGRLLSLKIKDIIDKEDGSWYRNENENIIFAATSHPALFRIGSIFDFSVYYNGIIHREIEKENAKQILYSVALKDNLAQLQVSTKGISKAENEDGRSEGDFPTGGGDEDAGGGGNNKNNDKTMLLLGIGILAAIFFMKRYKR